MKILTLGLDASVLKKNSHTASRAIKYGGIVKKYVVIVPNTAYKDVNLSSNVKVFGIKTQNKIIALYSIYKFTNRLLKNNKVDVISVQDQYYLAVIGLILSKKYKTGFEIQIHGFEKYSGLRKIIANHVIPKAGSMRCVSERLKAHITATFKVDKEKIVNVPILITKKPKNINAAFIPEKSFVFLLVARLVKVKNIPLLIQAFKDVSKKKDAKLWIVGDGPLLSTLNTLIKKEGLEDRIVMWPEQENIGKFYKSANAFVLSSNQEGWGMVVIEAASHGLPIIMTDVGCAGEFIKNNVNGVVIPVNDKKALVKSMTTIMENHKLRSSLGRRAAVTYKSMMSNAEILKKCRMSWRIASTTQSQVKKKSAQGLKNNSPNYFSISR